MRRLAVSIGVFLYFLLATLYVTFPLLFSFTNSLPGIGDEYLITWILNWNIHAFIHHPLTIFDAPIYYPYTHTLAYSDTFFTSSLIALIPTLVGQQPAIAFNTTYLVSLTTLGYFTYLFLRYLTNTHLAGIVSGTLAAYSTYTLSRYMHLQVIGIQWIPLSLLCFFLFLKKKQFRYLFLCSFFFLLQAANSFLPAYFLLFCFSCFIGAMVLRERKALALLLKKNVLFLIVCSAIVLFLLGKPYLQVSQEFSYVRDIRDTIHFANRPEYSLYPSDRTRLKEFLHNTFYKEDKGPYTYEGYLGGPLLVTSVISFLLWVKSSRKEAFINRFLFIAGSSFILSLGPALQWAGHVVKEPLLIPLPYAVLYYVIPGFQGFRNSARWEMLTVFALSVVVGLTFARFLKNTSHSIRYGVMALLCLAVLGEAVVPSSYVPVPKKETFPPIYEALDTLPKNAAIVEMPIYNWDMLPYSFTENKRLYYHTRHFRPTVNGGSGFSPPPWQQDVRMLFKEFPNEKAIDYLKQKKITHIVVHKEDYDLLANKKFVYEGFAALPGNTILERLSTLPTVRLLYNKGNDYLFRLQ